MKNLPKRIIKTQFEEAVFFLLLFLSCDKSVPRNVGLKKFIYKLSTPKEVVMFQG